MSSRVPRTAFPFLLCGACLALALFESAGRTSIKAFFRDRTAPILSFLEELRFPDGKPRTPQAAGGQACDESRLECARLRYELGVMAEQLGETGREIPVPGSGFRTVGARVIKLVGWNGDRRLAVIDLGSSSGIRPGMGVVKGNSAVGRILECGASTSVVRFLSDPGSKVAATLLPPGLAESEFQGFEGVVEGTVGTGGEMRLKHIRRSVPVACGDFILTSGRAGDFPAGLVAGTVEHVGNDDFSQFHEIRLSPPVDAASLRTVAVAVPLADCPGSEVGR